MTAVTKFVIGKQSIESSGITALTCCVRGVVPTAPQLQLTCFVPPSLNGEKFGFETQDG